MASEPNDAGAYPRGELEGVLIATVVAAGDKGITAIEVYVKLAEWGYRGSSATVASRLAKLASKGLVDTKAPPVQGVPTVYLPPGAGPD